MSEQGERDEIVRVLRSRLPQLLADEYGEEPRDWCELGSTRRISAHLADALADLLAARDRRVRGEAVRSTADAWTQGAWSDVMLPKPTPPAVPVIAYSNRVGGWLRDRANEIEAE